jgi:hypothetical protein
MAQRTSGDPALLYVRLPFTDLANGRCQLEDLMGQASYEPASGDWHASGLYLDLSPWEASFFSLKRIA